jgi:hypothetical protein
MASHLKWKKIEYKTLYLESAIILTIGLLGWIYLFTNQAVFNEKGIFNPIIINIQPIDLLFMGLSLLTSTILLDFLTRIYNLDRTSLLAILPWTLTGQYRFLHEFLWVYHYWITMNVIEGNFSDWIPWLEKGTSMAPALLTHAYAMLLILFSVFNFIVILHSRRQLNE